MPKILRNGDRLNNYIRLPQLELSIIRELHFHNDKLTSSDTPEICLTPR
ncbi:hypothetical protein L2778_004397 [Vibrio vulnificus]|nr:hypothetical protein [Vibrio vulnificus]